MLGAGREVLTHKAGLALLRGVCVCVCVCVRTLLVHSTGPVIERAFEDCGGKTWTQDTPFKYLQ